jgi:hypothetical protein
MKIPNAGSAVVERRKITEYLLNPSHPDNGGKAAFFFSMGFTAGSWEAMASALCEHAAEADATQVDPSPYGCKFIVDGQINTPVGKRPRIRSVWILNNGTPNPRLITAYRRG